VGKVGKWSLALVVCAAAYCGKGHNDPVVTNVIPDAGTPDSGIDAGQPTPDAGGTPDAGPPDAGPVDGGTPDAGPQFGGPGPWPIKNVEYGLKDGIEEMPAVGVTTDETQNLWVATNSALYLLRPGDAKFKRFDGHDGLHMPGFPAASCYDSAGVLKPCPSGEADTPGISEIVGGGPNEVFVGYFGHHDWSRTDDGEETDPFRHSGKLDWVRLNKDGSIAVIRFDMVSNNSVQYWHNKTVWKMVYDHFKNRHELYVGTDHGVDKISADLWKEPDKDPVTGAPTWFLLPQNQQVWMSDHLHPQACKGHVCETGPDGEEKYTQLLGDFRGLAIDAHGDLWVGGRWAAGKIRYTADNRVWFTTPRTNDGKHAIDPALGDGNCPGFCPPQLGDPVNISGITIAKDGLIWFSSGTIFNDPADVPYGIASTTDGYHFTHYDPVRDLGMPESHIRDMIALPDGRLVVAGLSSGLVFWDPATGKHTSVRAGQGIPDDGVLRIQLDTMVDPPALQVATRGGAAVLRVLP
jgi:hypothetical protein